MKPRRKMRPVITLAQNFRLAMTDLGLTFKDLSQQSGVSYDAAYRMAGKRGPVYPTAQAFKVGAVLGFTQKQVEEKIRVDRLEKSCVYSKSEVFYQKINELLQLFESK